MTGVEKTNNDVEQINSTLETQNSISDCGIYKMFNTLTKRTYIGMSKHIFTRWKNHYFSSYRENCDEYEKTLYRAIRKYGIEAFTFSILEFCEESQLGEREKYWIRAFNSHCEGYNETDGGDCPPDHHGEWHPLHIVTENDVIAIRRRYANKERRRDVYADYQDVLSRGGFDKIWKGENWQHICMDVYTKENKEFHKHDVSNAGSKNGRARLTEDDVRAIRTRKKNGETSGEVYKDYADRVTLGSFRNTWSGLNWKHIVV